MADLLNLLHVPDASVTCAMVGADGLVGEIVCTGDDLVSMIDGYWTVHGLMADRLMRGVPADAI